MPRRPHAAQPQAHEHHAGHEQHDEGWTVEAHRADVIRRSPPVRHPWRLAMPNATSARARSGTTGGHRHFTQRSYRGHLGVVPQDPLLFNTPVRDNVGFIARRIRKRSHTRSGRPTRRNSSATCPRALTPVWVITVLACRAASACGSPSPGPSTVGPRVSSSTRPPARSTARPNARSRRPLSGSVER